MAFKPFGIFYASPRSIVAATRGERLSVAATKSKRPIPRKPSEKMALYRLKRLARQLDRIAGRRTPLMRRGL